MPLTSSTANWDDRRGWLDCWIREADWLCGAELRWEKERAASRVEMRERESCDEMRKRELRWESEVGEREKNIKYMNYSNRAYIKEDDFVSYRTVLLEYFIPALELVQKQGWIVPPKIPGCTGLFRLFWWISELFGGIFILDWYKYNWIFLKKT